ncbi:MAG: ribose transport system substrate-binding protein [Microbacteriaceae bacterium]|jgi:ABC-type sugar transport system substrate-binding protein|nr:ribose transport system substrate-binding protein [Microbacteriaceae bacterium]
MSNRTASRAGIKRLITVGSVVAIAALGLTACSSTSASSTPNSGSSKKLTIAFVVGASSDPFFQAMKVGAQDEANALGVNLVFQGNATTYSPATQIPIVNQVLALKPSGLALAPTDPVALQNSVTQAVNAGIPVVNVDSKVNDQSKVISFITGDNAQGGSVAADTLAKAIGYQAGGTYQVVVGLTSATATTNVDRLNGFKAEIAAKYPGIDIVATGYSQSNPTTANTNINNWLTTYPKLSGIFAIDGTNATGAAAALQAKGLTGKVALIGYDAYKTNVDLIGTGVFTALVAQDPAAEGKDAVDTLVKYIKAGNKADGIKKSVTLPNIVLDRSTSAADLTKFTYVQG